MLRPLLVVGSKAAQGQMIGERVWPWRPGKEPSLGHPHKPGAVCTVAKISSQHI